jgi:hypothetical protein
MTADKKQLGTVLITVSKFQDNARLLKVVLTNVWSRGAKSFSSGRTDAAEVRRATGDILPPSRRLGDPEIGESGISSCDK